MRSTSNRMCHPMPSGWSGTDERAIRDTPMGSIPQLVKWQVSLVHTTIDAWIARFDQFDGDIHWAIPVAINGDFEQYEKACYAQVREALKPPSKTRYYDPVWDNAMQPPLRDWEELLSMVTPEEQNSYTGDDHLEDEEIDCDYDRIGDCGECQNPIVTCWEVGDTHCACNDVFEHSSHYLGLGLCPQCGDDLIMWDNARGLECENCGNTYTNKAYEQALEIVTEETGGA